MGYPYRGDGRAGKKAAHCSGYCRVHHKRCSRRPHGDGEVVYSKYGGCDHRGSDLSCDWHNSGSQNVPPVGSAPSPSGGTIRDGHDQMCHAQGDDCDSATYAYADPPYPGCAHMYPENEEVDLLELILGLDDAYPDGWAVSTHVRGLLEVGRDLPAGSRVASWVRTQGPLHPPLHFVTSWEPLIFKTAVVYTGGAPPKDSLVAMTTNRGFMAKRHGQQLTGSKPAAFGRWVLQLLGWRPGDTLDDVFPGTRMMDRVITTAESQVELGAY